MTLKQYLILMSFGTLICWIAWGFTLFSVDPYHASFLGFFFFYSSFYLAVLGSFSVVGFLIKRKIIKNDEIIFRHVKRTFRQGATFSAVLVLAMVLQQIKILTWWNGMLLFLLLLILEGIIFTNRKYSNRDYV